VHGSRERIAVIGMAAALGAVAVTASAGAAETRLPPTGFNHLKSERVLGNDPREIDHFGLRDLKLMSRAAAPYFRSRFRLDQVDRNNNGTLESWGLLDNLVREAAKRGVTILPIFIRLRERSGYPGRYLPPRSDHDRRRFGSFAQAAARRYGPAGQLWKTCRCPARPIRVWEVWNEQNVDHFWHDPDPVEYGLLLREITTGLRRADPSARVLLGGLAYFGRQFWDANDFLRIVIERYGVAAFDGAAVHFYEPMEPGATLDSIGRTAATLSRYAATPAGAPRHQLWVTEFGWGSFDDQSEQMQQEYLKRFLAQYAARREDWNLGPLFWYALRDYHVPKRLEYRLGLRRTAPDRADGGPKPGWADFAGYAHSTGMRSLPRGP
jgi:hypothetical protein